MTAEQTAKIASALLRSGTVLIQAYLPTTAGLSIACGPVYAASSDNVSAVGASVRAALSLPYSILPHPQQNEWPAVQRPMLQAAGVKSWKTLARGSKAVGITRNGVELQLTPSAHYEQAGGTTLEDKDVTIALDHPELGGALMEAFSRCE